MSHIFGPVPSRRLVETEGGVLSFGFVERLGIDGFENASTDELNSQAPRKRSVIYGHVVDLFGDAVDERLGEGDAEERAVRCDAGEPIGLCHSWIEQGEAKATKDVLERAANAQHVLSGAVGFNRVVARIFGSADDDLRGEHLSTADHVIEHRCVAEPHQSLAGQARRR